ncbi:uncharacterized protein BDZ83DRAFT_229673 [Colletotrichum acutatum]|uniref:Uncharacterized protein n=1 Tax=Glomerella acutata TaxID=27357 RepID=A0AAD8U968_GLOAC|nr:uncharacterized protein BDZ83DRAFT_229673 [Colletotrichum acutatum]KAK1703556.1 hypothetical protein BDZ83DRAFT_229673 [Colletotrichum acutatum]
MATYAQGTKPLAGPVPGQPVGLMDGPESQSTQETGSTSLELCRYEKGQSTEEEERSRSFALIQRISEKHRIEKQASRNQPKSRELQQYLDVLKDAIPRLPDNNLLPGPEMPTITFSRPRLSYPIIIKQRLSGISSPKFSRTYPSGLQNCGIGKKDFLRFIDDVNRVDEPSGSPGDHVMNMDGFAGMTALTTSHPMLLSMGIGVASYYGKNTPRRSAISEILRKANNELFYPRGLVCVLVPCRRAEPKEANKTPVRGGAAAASTNPTDRGREKKIKLRQKTVGRLRDNKWPVLSQFEFLDAHNSHPNSDGKRPPLRQSHRSRRGGNAGSESGEKRGLGQVMKEHHENENIVEGRLRQSTSRCANSKHPARMEDETNSLSSNKAAIWDSIWNLSSNSGFAPEKVEVGSLPADFFTAETDEDAAHEETQQTESKSKYISTFLEHRAPSQGRL